MLVSSPYWTTLMVIDDPPGKLHGPIFSLRIPTFVSKDSRPSVLKTECKHMEKHKLNIVERVVKQDMWGCASARMGK